MMSKIFFLFLLLPFILCAALDPTIPSVAEVERQLAEAEAEFKEAKKMFNPWYAGPLLTPSANNVSPGHFNVQPYLFFTTTYGVFTSNRATRSTPNIYTLNPVVIFQAGLLRWLDFTISLQSITNWQKGENATNIGDTSISFGTPLLKETAYQPAIRLVFTESFPTGKYEKLNRQKNGIDATGSGSYESTVSLNFSKVIWWIATHPFKLRASFNYTVPFMVNVQQFNAYGGGFGTRGKVKPGNKLSIDTSIEYSFTQKWVFATDFVYTYDNHSSFSGRRGQTEDGMPATVGLPSSDQFSIAPAIEYNPSQNMGFIVGGWFTLTGRNATNFASAIVTMYYYW